MQVIRYAAGDWGVGELWLDGEVSVWHELPTTARADPHPLEGALSPPSVTLPGAGARVRDGSVPEVAQRVMAYFAGQRVSFGDLELDLEWCTPFQLAVAEALRAVPYAETVTYGELAALAGYPNAHRAAGTFCAHNRLPLILPCHRVVAAGGLGSYGSLGGRYKRRLLELEGAAL
jgi:methylated-DNA-[protein]-cysteine S-methyltransferase